eukprot:TRINITY_DN15563_c0_g1_i1.p2 TRINITY_DN15563_c0_g1~~TRINITY_DN15563_c0_g1_i1.p2  ORF type:complete len:117 (-),score=38.39 TRINITY_DN15563_c0_g1_i1:59-409(-)
MAELEERNKQNYEAIVFMLKKYGKQNGCEYTLTFGALRGYLDGKLSGLPSLLKTMKRKNILVFVGDTFTDDSLEITLLGDVDMTAYTPKKSVIQDVYQITTEDYTRVFCGGKTTAC